jgi:hypothetical protein
MRRAIALSFILLLSAMPAGAQDWAEYKNVPDGFRVLFPGQPKVEEIKWTVRSAIQ